MPDVCSQLLYSAIFIPCTCDFKHFSVLYSIFAVLLGAFYSFLLALKQNQKLTFLQMLFRAFWAFCAFHSLKPETLFIFLCSPFQPDRFSWWLGLVLTGNLPQNEFTVKSVVKSGGNLVAAAEDEMIWTYDEKGERYEGKDHPDVEFSAEDP